MRAPRLVLLAIVLLAPHAAAATLHDFEAVHPPGEKSQKASSGDLLDQAYPFTVGAADVGRGHAIVFRGFETRAKLIPFTMMLCDDNGREVWWMNGTRGVQTFPDIVPPAAASPRSVDCEWFSHDDQADRTLGPGGYTLFLKGEGRFQVTDKFLERGGNLSVNGTLRAPADAWVLVGSQRYSVAITGPVAVEQYDFASDPHDWASPATLIAEQGVAYVFTVTGAEGASYHIELTPAAAGAARTPALGILGVAVAAALVAARLRRRG